MDKINHPRHYVSHPSGLECWEVTKHLPAELKDITKYLWRKDLKNGPEDILKALWYTKEVDAITYLALTRNRDLYAKNLINAQIAKRHENNTILGEALQLIITGLTEDANDFIYQIHELENKINNQTPLGE